MKVWFGVAIAGLLLLGTVTGISAAPPPDWNSYFNECPNGICGAPPSGGVGGGGAAGGPLVIAYTWGPLFSVQDDIDADGWPDAGGLDNCRNMPNDPADNDDGDAYGNVCDLCPNLSTIDNLDQDRDGLGDLCDPDRDGDAVEYDDEAMTYTGRSDNCPLIWNPIISTTGRQPDADGDGIGDACDDDDDNDGIPDIYDNCSKIENPSQTNDDFYIDGDYSGNACDNDLDNDEFADDIDLCPYLQSGVNTDVDGDGVGDPCDNCPHASNPDQRDSDMDGRGDVCDG